jgi:PAS domain S-box-containing protein
MSIDHRRGLMAGVATLAILVALDVLLGSAAVITTSYMLAPFAAALVAGRSTTLMVSALALGAAIASGLWNDNFAATDYFVRATVVAAGCAFALEAATARQQAARRLRQQRLLASVANISEPGISLDQAVARVTNLLVPEYADLAAVDAVRGDTLDRLSVRVTGSRGPETEQRLLERGASPPKRPGGIGDVALAGREQLIERMDPQLLRDMSIDDEDFDFLRTLCLLSEIVVPLRTGGRSIGALTVTTTTRSGRRYGPEDLDFVKVVAGRVALALDNAGLSRALTSVEQQLQAILASLGEAVTVQDRSGALVYANQAAADLLGASSVAELLTTPSQVFMDRFITYNEDGSPLRIEQLPGRHVLAGEPAEPLVVRAVNRTTGDERWRLTKATPVVGPDGEVALAVNIIEDITEAKRAEFAQRLLADASGVLSSSLDYADTLERVAQLAVPELADWCGVAVPRGELMEQLAVVHSDPDKVDFARRFSERYPSRVEDPTGAAEVLRTGESQLYPVITDEMLVAGALDDEHLELIRKLGMASVMIVPMRSADRVVGVISLVSAESGRRFTQSDLELAEELGRRAGTALENARLYTELSTVARTLQEGLLPPSLPSVPGWTMDSLYLPAAADVEVGGDFYDVFPTGAGWMAVIGDVVGRGAAAASLTSMARYTLRTAGSLVGTPTMGLARLNESLRERGEMALCTAAVLLLRDDGGEASLVCAGHPLPILVRDGKPQAVGRTGPLLGAFEHGHWLAAPLHFEPGDVLVLYTDGVIDARSMNGSGRFGEERLEQVLAGTTDAGDAVARIRAALVEFAGDEQTDDTAVLALQRN